MTSENISRIPAIRLYHNNPPSHHNISGIVDYCTLMSAAGMPSENRYTTKEILDLIASHKLLNFIPGDLNLDSNSGYFLLGEIVNRFPVNH